MGPVWPSMSIYLHAKGMNMSNTRGQSFIADMLFQSITIQLIKNNKRSIHENSHSNVGWHIFQSLFIVPTSWLPISWWVFLIAFPAPALLRVCHVGVSFCGVEGILTWCTIFCWYGDDRHPDVYMAELKDKREEVQRYQASHCPLEWRRGNMVIITLWMDTSIYRYSRAMNGDCYW